MRFALALLVGLAGIGAHFSSTSSGVSGFPVTSLAAAGGDVYAGTEGGGLLQSTDGGLTFHTVGFVECPSGVVRDVAAVPDISGFVRTYAACGDLRVAWVSPTRDAWRKLDSGAEVYSDICPQGDNGPGRPLVQEDPLNDERPTRLSGLLRCGFIDCDPYQTIQTNASYVSRADLYPAFCPFRTSRLLAPFSPYSPFVVWMTRENSGATVYRGLARNRVSGAGPTYYGNQNLERIGAIPHAVLELARDRQRPSRLLAATARGLWLSVDEGRTWTMALDGSIAAVAADPMTPGLYIAARDRTVLASTDGGTSWITAFTAQAPVVAMTIDAVDPTRILVATGVQTVESFRLLFALASPAGRPAVRPPHFGADSGSIEIRFVGRSTEASSYRLERRLRSSGDWLVVATVSADPPGQAGLLVDTAPPSDVELAYRVVAQGSGGVEAASDEVFGVAPSTEPISPDELMVSTVTDGTRRLTWRDRSGREDGYVVEFLAQDFTWRPLVQLPPNSSTYSLDTSINGFFRVRARNDRSLSEATSAVSAGGARPSRAPDLEAVLWEGPSADVTITAEPDASEVILERSIDDASFADIARLTLPLGPGKHSVHFADSELTKDHNVLYRARPVNPAGEGPRSSVLSLGTWTSPPEAPAIETAVYTESEYKIHDFRPKLSVSWKDLARSEDGDRVHTRGVFQGAAPALAAAPRNAQTLSVDYRLPPGALYHFTASKYGDQMVTMESFNSAGPSESQPIRLRLWPPDEQGEFAGLYSDQYEPHLLAPVIERPGPAGASWTTEAIDVEMASVIFPDSYYRVLESSTATLLAGLFPGARFPPAVVRNRVLSNVFEAVRQDHPLLPRGVNLVGAMYRRLSPWVGSPTLVRVTAPVTVGERTGRGGFAYSSLPISRLTASPLLVPGLSETERVSSALGLVHPGVDPASVTLRVSVVDGATGASETLPDVEIGRGETRTIEHVLSAMGRSNVRDGYALIERVGGGAFHAYGLTLDQEVSEGLYLKAAIPEHRPYESLPVVVESASYDSEVVLTNASPANVDLSLAYRESLPAYRAHDPVVVHLRAGAQKRIPAFLEFLRKGGVPIAPAGKDTHVGTVRVSRADGSPLGSICTGVRVATADGRFGLFISAVPAGAGTEGLVNWQEGLGRSRIWSLLEGEAERSNAAVANLTDGNMRIRVEVIRCPDDSQYSCEGRYYHRNVVHTDELDLPPGGWYQINRPLARFAVPRGSVDFVRVSGDGQLFAYGVVVDDVTGDASLFEGTGPSR